LGLLGSCFAAKATFYVSTSGNDTAAGDESNPFLTLGAALAAGASSNGTEGVLINVGAGIYTSPGNAGLTYTIDTLFQYYQDDNSNSTVVEFACVDANTDVYFNAANNFVLDGNDGDSNIMFDIVNCKTGVSFYNTLPGNTTYNDYYLHILFTNFGANDLGIDVQNVYQVLIQDSSFNGTNTFAIQAQGNGTGGYTFSQVEVDRVVFNNAGAININSFDTGKLEDITYQGGNSGAFVLRDGAWQAVSLTISDSTTGARSNGAGLNLQNANITLSQSSFTNCQAANGGAIYFENVDASLDTVTFTNNYCMDPDCVGGAYAHYNSLITISSLSGLTFTGNNASYGGAIEFYGTILGYDIEELVFDNNTAVVNGSCIDCCSSTGCGFALNITGDLQ